jgi:hypothetical protein
MEIDYKIKREVLHDDGTKTVVMRVYEGERVLVDEVDYHTGEPVQVERYIRSKMIGEKELKILTQDIESTELRKVLNVELEAVATQKKLTVITEQSDVAVKEETEYLKTKDTVDVTEKEVVVNPK